MTDDRISRRCVVWFGQPTDEECACLARAGWRTRVGDARLQGGVGMRRCMSTGAVKKPPLVRRMPSTPGVSAATSCGTRANHGTLGWVTIS